jgi:hypothetical protein
MARVAISGLTILLLILTTLTILGQGRYEPARRARTPDETGVDLIEA